MMSEKQSKASAFAHLDHAELGWFHLRAVLVSGVGFFTDAYDIFVISQVLPMIYQAYGKVSPATDGWAKASTSWGNLVGQLAFGYLGDRLGRKKIYGTELLIMIFCTVASAFSAPIKEGFGIITVLSIWRFLLGIGIGGDYPMSAIITSEFANIKHRGMMMSAVFAMQGLGFLLGGIVSLVTLVAFKSAIDSNNDYFDIVWRIVVGFGVIPALFAVYFRMTIPETPRFTVAVIGDNEQAQLDSQKILELNGSVPVVSSYDDAKTEGRPSVSIEKPNTFKDFVAHFGQYKNGIVLFGTAYCWFALDIAFYGLQLNNNTIISLINFGPHDHATPYELVYNAVVGNLIVVCMGTAVGYWFTVFFIEIMGRKPIQFMGFGVITVCLLILAIFWNSIKTNGAAFITVYTIASFFFNFGPNATTFVVPGEVFPTRWRSTGHGFSAACGKAGAIIGVQVISPYFQAANKDVTIPIILYIFAAVMFSGFLATFCIPETKGKSLEELSGEDEISLEK